MILRPLIAWGYLVAQGAPGSRGPGRMGPLVAWGPRSPLVAWGTLVALGPW